MMTATTTWLDFRGESDFPRPTARGVLDPEKSGPRFSVVGRFPPLPPAAAGQTKGGDK
jgi:hypothetical protein